MKCLILGAGPVGLLTANILKACDFEDFAIWTKDVGGMFNKTPDIVDIPLGQRTLFYDKQMEEFLNKYVCKTTNTDLSHKNGVFFRGKVYPYPIQYFAYKLPFADMVKFYSSYLFNKKTKGTSYYDWSMNNYGKWMADNILLPHTWKTLKEDLREIDALQYGKKVLPFKMFSKVKDLAFDKPDDILKILQHNVEDKIVKTSINKICFDDGISVSSEGSVSVNADIVFNTISIFDVVKMLSIKDDNLQVAINSLNYNSMFGCIFILPTNMVNDFGRNIIYFPEKEYMFSKVVINKNNGYASITCECSFRRNDESKLACEAYKQKVSDKIEHQLIQAGILLNQIISTYKRSSFIVKPCYIITDPDYYSSNSFIQTYLEHYHFYNIGRFAQWSPSVRVEHAFHRALYLIQKHLRLVP